MKLSIFDIPTECKGQRLLNISATLVILIFNNIHILLFNVSYPKGLTLITHQLVVNKVIFVQLSNQSNILVFVVKKTIISQHTGLQIPQFLFCGVLTQLCRGLINVCP